MARTRRKARFTIMIPRRRLARRGWCSRERDGAARRRRRRRLTCTGSAPARISPHAASVSAAVSEPPDSSVSRYGFSVAAAVTVARRPPRAVRDAAAARCHRFGAIDARDRGGVTKALVEASSRASTTKRANMIVVFAL